MKVLLDTKKSTVLGAFNADMKDYEDAVQFQTCVENSINLVITRNTKDFTNQLIKAVTPQNYLSL